MTDRTMPLAAGLYVLLMVPAGTLALIWAVFQGVGSDPLRLLAYLTLAVVAAAMKIRLPGMSSTVSVNFLFGLVAMIELGAGAAALVVSVSTLAQCLWKPQRPPKPIQVVFSTASATLAMAAANWVYSRAIQAYSASPATWNAPFGAALAILAGLPVYFAVTGSTVGAVIRLT